MTGGKAGRLLTGAAAAPLMSTGLLVAPAAAEKSDGAMAARWAPIGFWCGTG